MTARQLDPSYTFQLNAEQPLVLDPEVAAGPAAKDGAKKAPPAESDDLEDDPAATETPRKRSIVEDMFEMPPDLLNRDRLTPSQTQPPEKNNRIWATPSEGDTRAAKKGGLDGPDPAVGNAHRSKSVSGRGATDRSGPPAARDGVAEGKDLPPADERRGQPAAKGQRSISESRNLRPYGPSSMRPTGMRDTAAYVDPRTGLPPGQGRAATVGTPYVAPNPYVSNPYAPMGQTSGVGTSRTATPPRPLLPLPPGNRYDGGRGYGD
jgi:hypothetical protein